MSNTVSFHSLRHGEQGLEGEQVTGSGKYHSEELH